MALFTRALDAVQYHRYKVDWLHPHWLPTELNGGTGAPVPAVTTSTARPRAPLRCSSDGEESGVVDDPQVAELHQRIAKGFANSLCDAAYKGTRGPCDPKSILRMTAAETVLKWVHDTSGDILVKMVAMVESQRGLDLSVSAAVSVVGTQACASSGGGGACDDDYVENAAVVVPGGKGRTSTTKRKPIQHKTAPKPTKKANKKPNPSVPPSRPYRAPVVAPQVCSNPPTALSYQGSSQLLFPPPTQQLYSPQRTTAQPRFHGVDALMTAATYIGAGGGGGGPVVAYPMREFSSNVDRASFVSGGRRARYPQQGSENNPTEADCFRGINATSLGYGMW